MAFRLISPRFSFVQFEQPDDGFCLPVFDINDVYFQFVLQADTSDEADDLCDLSSSGIAIGTKIKCSDALTEFTGQVERFRISDLQVLYNWQHGIETLGSISVGQCFRVGVDVGVQSFCSNCFQKIRGSELTAVVEYGNDENAFGFNYCASGTNDEDEALDCSDTFISFTSQSTLVIPYTAALIAKHGVIPAIQTYIYNPMGELQDMGISATFDTFPPTQISFDFGGPSSGVIKLL